jgi:hypothetical protein
LILSLLVLSLSVASALSSRAPSQTAVPVSQTAAPVAPAAAPATETAAPVTETAPKPLPKVLDPAKDPQPPSTVQNLRRTDVEGQEELLAGCGP